MKRSQAAQGMREMARLLTVEALRDGRVQRATYLDKGKGYKRTHKSRRVEQ